MTETMREASPPAVPSTTENYILRLYVSGVAPRSAAAIKNLKEICATYLPGRYDLQIIDIYQQPELACSAQIIATPTLIKQLPLPLRQVTGDLSEKAYLLTELGLIPAAPAN